MEEIIKECDNCKYVMTDTESFPCNRCKRNAVDKWEPIPKQTNADRIRSMTDEELAEFLGNEKIRDEHSLCSDFGNGCYYYCKKNHACHDNIKQLYIEWLQSEAE